MPTDDSLATDRIHVLIVDDNPDNRTKTIELLQQQHVASRLTIEAPDTLQEALTLSAQADVIVLSFDLNDQNYTGELESSGPDFLRRLFRLNRLSQTAIVPFSDEPWENWQTMPAGTQIPDIAQYVNKSDALENMSLNSTGRITNAGKFIIAVQAALQKAMELRNAED